MDHSPKTSWNFGKVVILQIHIHLKCFRALSSTGVSLRLVSFTENDHTDAMCQHKCVRVCVSDNATDPIFNASAT